MPVLPLEPFVYPDGLFTTDEVAAEAARWWVLHVRPRTEKSLARALLVQETAFFLPLSQRPVRQRGRLLVAHVPLFPGYVFVRGDNQDRLRALTTRYVVRCLPVDDQALLRADLSRVYHLMATGAPLVPVERLQPGMPVRITAGPFAGVEGSIVRQGKRLTFVVAVHFLQRGVEVEIDAWMIEPAGNRPRPAAAGA